MASERAGCAACASTSRRTTSTRSATARAVLESIEEPINLYLFFSDKATENAADAARIREPRPRDARGVRGERARRQARAERRRSAAVLRGGGPRRAVRPAGARTSARPAKPSISGSRARTASATTDSIPFFQPDPPRKRSSSTTSRGSSTTSRIPTRPSSACSRARRSAAASIRRRSSRLSRGSIVEQAKQLFEVRDAAARARSHRGRRRRAVGRASRRCSTKPRSTRSISSCMRGGRALIFVDPAAEILARRRTRRARRRRRVELDARAAVRGLGRRSSRRSSVVADKRYALSIGGRVQPDSPRRLARPRRGGHEPGGLDHLRARRGQPRRRRAFHARRRRTAKLTPLLTSSDEAAVMPADRFQFLPDPGELLERLHADAGSSTCSPRASKGRSKTAFPDGAPAAPDREAPVDAALAARAHGLDGEREPRARRRRRHAERPALGAGAELPRPAARDRVREQRRLRHQRARQPLRQRGSDRPAQPRDLHAAVHDGRGAAPRGRCAVPRDRAAAPGGARRNRAQARRAASRAQRQQLAAHEPRAARRRFSVSSTSRCGSGRSCAPCAASSTRDIDSLGTTAARSSTSRRADPGDGVRARRGRRRRRRRKAPR